MTTTPRRIVIDLEFTEDEDTSSDLADALRGALIATIEDLPAYPHDALDSCEIEVVDPRESFEIVAAGNAVSGFRFYGPVPPQLDGGDIASDGHFDDDDWVTADVEPYPNPSWMPLPDHF